jgi:hypothetical protein
VWTERLCLEGAGMGRGRSPERGAFSMPIRPKMNGHIRSLRLVVAKVSLLMAAVEDTMALRQLSMAHASRWRVTCAGNTSEVTSNQTAQRSQHMVGRRAMLWSSWPVQAKANGVELRVSTVEETAQSLSTLLSTLRRQRHRQFRSVQCEVR